ncbi:MAG: pseudouridine synthase [Peptostreptococcaceae bacterium]|nr:pseudouridine synthase [Peptostreptococcaceae bacterium]
MAKIRIDKLLSNMGCGSRSEIKKAAKLGSIKLNDKVEKDTSKIIDSDVDTISFDDEVIKYRQYIYLLMNKPQGVVSATFDNLHTTVVDLLPEAYQIYDPFPVGRLDIDTEGLLVLTNDGKLAHEILSPKRHVDKKYFAEVDGPLGEKEIQKFLSGITLDDGYTTLPSKLEILSSDADRSLCNVTIREGKFHQIKRMFADAGRKVLFLKRIQMGELKLDPKLQPGELRELNESEVGLLLGKP